MGPLLTIENVVSIKHNSLKPHNSGKFPSHIQGKKRKKISRTLQMVATTTAMTTASTRVNSNIWKEEEQKKQEEIRWRYLSEITLSN